MRRGIIIGPLLLAAIFIASFAAAGCGDTPESTNDTEAGATYVRDYVTACREHGGIAAAATDDSEGAPFVICNDNEGFAYDDQKLVRVQLERTVRP